MNHRPSGYEPDELPGCSTPRYSLTLSSIDNYTIIYANCQAFYEIFFAFFLCLNSALVNYVEIIYDEFVATSRSDSRLWL